MKYFTKLLSMLLVGVMLSVTACTDYDQDIKDLNNKVDALEKELVEGQINPLKADLAKTKTDLEAALAAAESRLAATHKADVDALRGADTKLQEAIDEANDAILDLEGALESEVAALEKEIDALEKALEAAKKEAADADAALKAELVGKITDLETQLLNKVNALQTKLEGDIQDLRDDMQEKIDAANEAIDAANEAIDALDLRADDLEATDEELKAKDEALQKEIDDTQVELAATKTALADAVAALEAADEAEKEAREKAVAALEDAIAALEAKLEGEINLLKHRDAEFEAQLSTAKRGIEALGQKVEAYYEQIKADAIALEAKLQAQIDANTAAIAQNKADINKALAAIDTINANLASLQGSIATINNTLFAHIASFTNYQSQVNGRLAALEASVATLEAAIADLKENVIPAIEEQIATNESLIKANAAGIADNAAALEAYKQAAAATFELLMKADTDLWAAISALNGYVFENKAEIAKLADEFAAYQTTIENELATKYQALKTEIAKLRSQHYADYDELQAQIFANYDLIDRNYKMIVKEIADREAADKAISEELAAFKKQYEEKVAELEAADKALNKRIDDLEAALEAFKKEVAQAIADAMAETLSKANEYTDQQVADLTIVVEKLFAQADANLKAAVAALEEAYKAADKALHDKIDAAVVALQEQITAILNRVQSIVFVPEYNDGKGTINYAYAGETLVEARSQMVYQVYPAECAIAIAKSEEAVLSYALEGLTSRAAEGPQFNIVAVEGSEDGRLYVTFDARNLGVDFYAGKKEYAASLILDSKDANLSTVYTNVVPVNTPEQITMVMMDGEDVISGLIKPTIEFEYTDTETVEKVLPEHRIVFDVDGTSYEGIEALNNAGYAVALERAMYFNRYQASLGYRPFDINENEDSIYEIKVDEVNGTLIANPVDVGYTYTAGTLKAEAFVRYSTTPVKVDVNFEGVSATWTYTQDAIIDAAKSGAYARGLDLTLDEESLNLPEDVTIDMVFADAPVSIKAYIGEEVATDVVAEILIKDGKYCMQIKNFAWDKSYEVKAVYEVKDKVLGDVCAIATVTIPFNTYDRLRDPLVINLDPSTIDFEANVESFNEISDNLDVVYETLVFGNKNFDITSDKWLEKNFGPGGWTATEFVVADGKEVTLPSGYNTYLALGADNGKTVYTNFSYMDFEFFVPAQVEYTKTVTTWYGQVIVLNKVLNFEFPVYDFKHNNTYVYGAGNDYYSQVQPEYTWGTGSDDLLKFDVAKVDLRAAFAVVDANGKKLTPAEQTALSLQYNFVIEDEEHAGITIDTVTDKLSYYGGKPSVNVRANLYIVHTNGAKYTVPTSFDEGGKYETYNVVKFNPIGKAQVTENPTIDVNNAIQYHVDVLDYIKLMDYRTGGRKNYNLIENGGWVIGNGANGFAQDKDVRAPFIYRIKETWAFDTSEVEEKYQDVLPFISFTNGTLTFDNSQQLELTAPFTIPVTLKFENCWMEKPDVVTVKVTFNPVK